AHPHLGFGFGVGHSGDGLAPRDDLGHHARRVAVGDGEIGLVELAFLEVDEATVGTPGIAVVEHLEARTGGQRGRVDAQHMRDGLQAVQAPFAFDIGDDVRAVFHVQAHAGYADFVRALLATVAPAIHVDLAEEKGVVGEHAAGHAHGPL